MRRPPSLVLHTAAIPISTFLAGPFSACASSVRTSVLCTLTSSCCTSTPASALFSLTERVRPVQRVGPACAAIAAATRYASSSSAPSAAASHFTSFEVESELLWAQEDLKELPDLTRMAPTHQQPRKLSFSPLFPSLPVTSPRSSHTTEDSKTHQQSCPAGWSPAAVDAAFSVLPVPLPALLCRRRWPSGLHGRLERSTPGYVEAATTLLSSLRNLWQQQQQQQQQSYALSLNPSHSGDFVDFAASQLLCEAHTEALLIVLELVVSPSLVLAPANDAAGSAAGFHAALLPCIMQLLCRRHAELTGRHLAHLSRLLLAHSTLFADWQHSASAPAFSLKTHEAMDQHLHYRAEQRKRHSEVWEAFLVLCYAIRRQLRRKHNRDCLEAFLWGLYSPVSDAERTERGGRGTRTLLPDSAALRARHAPPVAHTSVSILANKAGVRKAALHHLLYRCLEEEAAALIGRQAAAHVDMLLSWALLLARDDMEVEMRDAVVHRLCKSSTAVRGASSSSSSSPASVREWKRLALRVTEGLTQVDSEHGRFGKALAPGAAVFAAVAREARQTGAWAVPAQDRQLLSVLPCKPQHRSGVTPQLVSSVPAGATHYVGAAHPTHTTASESALRVKEAASITLRAYARLRWGPLTPEVLLQSPAWAKGTHQGMSAASTSTRRDRESCEEEVVDLVHTALELPRHAWSLSEAIAARIVRCVRHRCAGAAAASSSGRHPASSLTQRQLLAAFRRLARHSRADVLTDAVVLQGEGGAVAVFEGSRTTTATPADDPFMLSTFLTGAAEVLAGQLRSTDEAAQMVAVWAHERSTAATQLPDNVLPQLREWVKALPPQLHSEKLVTALQHAMHHESLLDASPLPSPDIRAQALWSEILRAAQPSEERLAPCHRRTSTTSAMALPEPTTLSVSPPAPAETATSAPVPLLSIRRLQWATLLGASPRREWLWCVGGRARTSMVVSAGVSHTWADLCTVVEATENDVGADVELACWRALWHRCSGSHGATAKVPWSVLRDWRWLDTVLTAPLCQSSPDSCTAAITNGTTADNVPAAAGTLASVQLMPSTPALSLSWQIILTYAECSPAGGDASGVERGGKHRRTCTAATAADADAHALCFLEWDEALRTLASYCDSCGDTAKLRSAAAAFVRCLVGFWSTFRPLPALALPIAPPRNSDHVSAALLAHYTEALRLHRTCALQSQSVSPQQQCCPEWETALPRMPDEFHLDVFRHLLQTRKPQWRQCEALLLLAEDAAMLCRQHSRGGTHTERGGERTTRFDNAGLQMPVRVYAEVLGMYAAHQQPVPAALLDAIKRSR